MPRRYDLCLIALAGAATLPSNVVSRSFVPRAPLVCQGVPTAAFCQLTLPSDQVRLSAKIGYDPVLGFDTLNEMAADSTVAFDGIEETSHFNSE